MGLRGGNLLRLGPSQADVVLQPPPYLWSTDRPTAPSRSLQLLGWVRKLAGGLVCGQEGVVLQSAWKGLPNPGRWVRDLIRAIRLRCWFRQLDGGVVCA